MPTPYTKQAASVYDAIYTTIKSYHLEAWLARRYIESFKQSDGNDLLSVACGTGLHDSLLKMWYKVEGIDLSPAQLEVAQERNPQTRYHVGDMRNFDMGRRYDVVTCLFGSIGYLTARADMQAAIATMAGHLEPGGILLLEPWYEPGDLGESHQSVQMAKRADLDIRRVNQVVIETGIAKITMHTYVTRDGFGEEPFSEYHEIAMYTIEEQIEAFRMAGLNVWQRWFFQHMPHVLIGRKPL